MTRRPAYTLLELMVALGSASVLVVGLSSALSIAAQGLDLEQGAPRHVDVPTRRWGGYRLPADARIATRYRSVAPTAIEFDVADRTWGRRSGAIAIRLERRGGGPSDEDAKWQLADDTIKRCAR